MRKIAFYGNQGSGRYTYANEMHHCDGVPRSSGSTIQSIFELYEETGNKGNMIHGEAPTRIFQMNRNESCYFSARSLLSGEGWSPERLADELNNKRLSVFLHRRSGKGPWRVFKQFSRATGV